MWTRTTLALLLALVSRAAAEAPAERAHLTNAACEQLPVAAPARADGEPLPAQAEARPGPVDSVRRIFDQASPDKIAAVKRIIAKQRPVLFALEPPAAGKLVGDLWVATDPPPPPAEDAAPSRCGSAVVVVGYDDARYGGALELLRDCGVTTYAETAFWMRYADFNTLCKCAVELVAAGAPPGPAGAPAADAPPPADGAGTD